MHVDSQVYFTLLSRWFSWFQLSVLQIAIHHSELLLGRRRLIHFEKSHDRFHSNLTHTALQSSNLRSINSLNCPTLSILRSLNSLNRSSTETHWWLRRGEGSKGENPSTSGRWRRSQGTQGLLDLLTKAYWTRWMIQNVILEFTYTYIFLFCA